MSSAFPTALDPSSAVGDAVAAIERRVGVTGSTDVHSVTYALSLVVPSLPHRTGGDKWVHSATGAAAGSNAFVVGTVYAIPFYVPTTAVYTGCGVIRTGPVTGAYERLGVYSDGGGVPDVLLFEFGRNSTGSSNTGFKYVYRSPGVSLTAGWVWLACSPQTAVNFTFSTVGTSTGAPVVLGTTVPSATGMTMGYSGSVAVADVLPASWGSVYTECAVVPLVYMARA